MPCTLLPAPSGEVFAARRDVPRKRPSLLSEQHAEAGRASRIRAQLRLSRLNRAAEVGPAGPLRLYKEVVRDQIHSNCFSSSANVSSFSRTSFINRKPTAQPLI